LYYRLNVILLKTPPLRERKGDVPLLADAFLKKFSSRQSKTLDSFSDEVLGALDHWTWPGNVRELENIIERAVVLSTSQLLDAKDLPFLSPAQETPENFFAEATQDFPTLQDLERRYVQLVLRRTGGKKEKAAQILGINRRTLLRWEKGSEHDEPEADAAAAHDPVSE
jgi:two-component system response regulator HydG